MFMFYTFYDVSETINNLGGKVHVVNRIHFYIVQKQ